MYVHILNSSLKILYQTDETGTRYRMVYIFYVFVVFLCICVFSAVDSSNR